MLYDAILNGGAVFLLLAVLWMVLYMVKDADS